MWNYHTVYIAKRIGLGVLSILVAYGGLTAFNNFCLFKLHIAQSLACVLLLVIFIAIVYFMMKRVEKFYFYKNLIPVTYITFTLMLIILPPLVLLLQAASMPVGKCIITAKVVRKEQSRIFILPFIYYKANMLVVASAGQLEKFNLVDMPDAWNKLKAGDVLAIEYYPLIKDHSLNITKQ